VTGSEATGSEATGSEVTGSEATESGSEAMESEVTGSEDPQPAPELATGTDVPPVRLRHPSQLYPYDPTVPTEVAVAASV
jgi:hypothetical protein